MVFSSPTFLFCFLPLTLLLCFGVPRGFRNTSLLLASLVFYAWGEGAFVALMLASIAGNWALGLALERAGPGRRGGWLLGLGVAFNLGLLAFFKYAGWLWAEVAKAWSAWGGGELPALAEVLERWGLRAALGDEVQGIHLPIGISFFTFQALSYVIDVRRGVVPAQSSFLRFGVYVSLFPQLIAGPIVRYRDVAAQIAERSVRLSDFASGARRFVIGLGKKMLIANSVGAIADELYALPVEQLSTSVAWLAMLAYALQIYFDFSGYSDMAIGLGRMLGFSFLENFLYPYVARSITDFWRRWHVSLSTWFRDYLYIPLGGNRHGTLRTYRNLVLVFFLCGLWHGASWSFVVWGLFHGFFLVLERAGLGRTVAAFPRLLEHGYTLLVVLVGWVFFRAESLDQALGVLRAAFGAPGAQAGWHSVPLYLTPHRVLALGAGVLGSLPWLPALQSAYSARARRAPLLAAFGRTLAFAGFVCVFYASVLELAAGTYNPFIYFRF